MSITNIPSLTPSSHATVSTFQPARLLSKRYLDSLLLKGNREHRSDAATKDATDEQCLLSCKKDTVLTSQASSVTRLNGLLLFCVTLAACLPRLLLAMQLDMVTDEQVYILGGKMYLPALLHHSLHSAAWSYNYEHPSLVKLLIGLAVTVNASTGSLLPELLAARLPSILCGTLLISALYGLGKAPFGRTVALLAALSLAFSPWLAFFSALAYLDMTMTMLVTLSYLLLWHARYNRWCYILAAISIGLAIASKYTAALALPGLILFALYTHIARYHTRLPGTRQWSHVPRLWYVLACALVPVTFFLADPAIWRDPLKLLPQSITYEWEHSYNGHLTFIAGKATLHAPQWTILLILFTKLSLGVTLPATLYICITLIRLVRALWTKHYAELRNMDSAFFLLFWLLSTIVIFSFLNIVVGTHYDLPATPPIAFAGALGATGALRFLRKKVTDTQSVSMHRKQEHNKVAEESTTKTPLRAIMTIGLLALLLSGSHLYGLTTIHAAEGYTSEVFRDENSVLQVAYPDYREAVQWLARHTDQQPIQVGLVALENTLNKGEQGVSWYAYNKDLPARITLTETHPDSYNLAYDYLVWPAHLVQRGYTIPPQWQSHIVHTIMGGGTLYCYILARNPATILR